MGLSKTFALLTCLLLVSVLGCGDSEAEKEALALNSARSWTEGNTEPVIGEIVTLVTSGVPGASLLSGVIAEQIAGLLSWEYSEPVKTTDDSYRVTATVLTRASIDLPLVGSKTYEARLPFDLQVDVNTGSVTKWSPNLTSATVGEIEASP